MKKFLWLFLFITVPVWAQNFPFRAVREGGEVPSARIFDIISKKEVDVKRLAEKGVNIFVFWGADSRFKRIHSLKTIKGILAFKDTLKFGFYPINVQQDPEDVIKGFMREAGYSGPLWVDSDREVYKAFGIFVMPSVIIAKDGIIFKGFGYTHNLPELVKAYVELALGIKTKEEIEKELNPKQKELPPEEKEALRYYRLGVTMIERGMAARAEEAFKKAIKIKGDYLNAYIGLAVALLQQDKKGELLGILKVLEDKASGDFKVKVIKARVLLIEGKPGDALEIANTLLFSKPGCPDVYVLLGDIYSKKAMWKKAASYYRKALDKCYNLGRLLKE